MATLSLHVRIGDQCFDMDLHPQRQEVYRFHEKNLMTATYARAVRESTNSFDGMHT